MSLKFLSENMGRSDIYSGGREGEKQEYALIEWRGFAEVVPRSTLVHAQHHYQQNL